MQNKKKYALVMLTATLLIGSLSGCGTQIKTENTKINKNMDTNKVLNEKNKNKQELSSKNTNKPVEIEGVEELNNDQTTQWIVEAIDDIPIQPDNK